MPFSIGETLNAPSDSAEHFSRWLKDNTAVATMWVLAGLAVKTVVIARGDVSTALAILQSAPVTLVVVGALLSALPLVLLVVVTWSLFCCVSHIAQRTFSRDALLLFVASLLISAAVSPWPVFAGGVVIGGLLYVAYCATPPRWIAPAVRSSAKIALGAVALYSLYALLYAVWLPHEELQRGAGKTTVGYVLDTGDGWTTVLLSGQRRIVRIPSDDVSGRQLCVRVASESGLLPHQSESLWSLIGRVSSVLAPAKLPTCPA